MIQRIQSLWLLLAAACAFAVGIREKIISEGLSAFRPYTGRLQVKTALGGATLIDDTYNANPDSMRAALRTLIELDADGRRIAVFGEMKELGSESEVAHWHVGQTAAIFGIDQLITIGDVAKAIGEAARAGGLKNITAVDSTKEAAELLGDIARPGDLILVKGSRSARTEQVIEAFGLRHSSFVISP